MTIKKILFYIYLFNFTLLSSQSNKIKELDSLGNIESVKLNVFCDYKGAIQLNKKILKEAEEISYESGVGWAYYRIANSYINLGQFEESYKNLKLAESYAKKIKDPTLEAAVLNGWGKQFIEQNLSYSLAIKKIREAERVSKTIKNKKNKKEWLSKTYKNLVSSYSNIQKWDSAYYYMHKSYSLINDIYGAESLANYHITISKNSDSSVYYLNKSEILLAEKPNLFFEKLLYYNLLASFHFSKKNYDRAIENYKIAVPLSKKSSVSSELIKAYKGLADSYLLAKDTINSKKYQLKFNNAKDSINNLLIDNLEYTVGNLVKDAEDDVSEKFQKKYNLSFILIGISFLVFIVLYYRNKFKLIHKRKNLKKKNIIIQEKDYLIETKNEEIRLLNKQVNENFDKLVELAKKNDLGFFVRFQEVYPQFQQNLIKINENLTTADLTFSAYIYLDFQTKEIAEYTFKSIKTIQNKKNSLRKKLHIPSSEDLYLWMKNMV